MSDANDNPLLRWSRRKDEARRRKAGEALAPRSDDVPAPDIEPGTAHATPAVINEAAIAPLPPEVETEELPDVETLTYESDFTAFLRQGVPDLVKQAALRKLWASDPVLANLDGLNDYDPQSMVFFEEVVAEPIAEVTRAVHDEIMDAKRLRDDQRHVRPKPSSASPQIERLQPDENAPSVAVPDDSERAAGEAQADPVVPDERA